MTQPDIEAELAELDAIAKALTARIARMRTRVGSLTDDGARAISPAVTPTDEDFIALRARRRRRGHRG